MLDLQTDKESRAFRTKDTSCPRSSRWSFSSHPPKFTGLRLLQIMSDPMRYDALHLDDSRGQGKWHVFIFWRCRKRIWVHSFTVTVISFQNNYCTLFEIHLTSLSFRLKTCFYTLLRTLIFVNHEMYDKQFNKM